MITQDDVNLLTEVFALARLQMVTSRPSDRDRLIALITGENVIKEKLVKVIAEQEQSKQIKEGQVSENEPRVKPKVAKKSTEGLTKA